MSAGIEAINAYVGRACIDVRRIFEIRGLDLARFGNLMMEQRSVGLPCEDPVTNAVNAAKPIVDGIGPAGRDRIEAVIVGTESGLDFGKSVSSYVQHYLGLPARCRSFEVKHACYGGTAALQSACAMVAANPVPGTKALVIATDAAGVVEGMRYWEPSHGAGAVAMLVGDQPEILEIDPGASGYHSYEVMDTCRPRADLAGGNVDLSLLSYLRCLEESFAAYAERVSGADIASTFDYLAFHTPFPGMVKGAHRALLRKRGTLSAAEIEADFAARVAPSLAYAMRVGNTYSAALYLALCSLIERADLTQPRRVGLFSYGSGCTSEFYSGVIGTRAHELLAGFKIGQALDERYQLDLTEYEAVTELGQQGAPGVRDQVFDVSPYARVYEDRFTGQGLLVLARISEFHRVYTWS